MTEIINDRYLYLRMFYCYISKEKSFTFIYIPGIHSRMFYTYTSNKKNVL